jgi:hypothetical protein
VISLQKVDPLLVLVSGREAKKVSVRQDFLSEKKVEEAATCAVGPQIQRSRK